MKIEYVPEQYYGDVIGDISRRRGQMTGESQRANAKIIEAECHWRNVWLCHRLKKYDARSRKLCDAV